VLPLGTGMTVNSAVDGDQSLEFQLSTADLAAVSKSQLTSTATSAPLPLPLAGITGARKDFDAIGGTLDLGSNRLVSVAIYYDLNRTASENDLGWQLAGYPTEGTFGLALPAGTSGTTIAYQIRITAPAEAMTSPLVIDDIAIYYGPYTKPKPAPKPSHKPKPKPTASSGGGGSGQSTQSPQPGAGNTGNGGGTGAGNGNGNGNVSGGGSSARASTTSHGKAVVHSATTIPQNQSPATASSNDVTGYALSGITAAQGSVAPVAGPVAGDAVDSGGHAQAAASGGAPGRLGVVLLGVCALIAFVAPWPLASRRLHALAGFDHGRQAVQAQTEEWLEQAPGRAATARVAGRPAERPRWRSRRGS